MFVDIELYSITSRAGFSLAVPSVTFWSIIPSVILLLNKCFVFKSSSDQPSKLLWRATKRAPGTILNYSAVKQNNVSKLMKISRKSHQINKFQMLCSSIKNNTSISIHVANTIILILSWNVLHFLIFIQTLQSAVTRNHSEKSINSILDYISTSKQVGVFIINLSLILVDIYM